MSHAEDAARDILKKAVGEVTDLELSYAVGRIERAIKADHAPDPRLEQARETLKDLLPGVDYNEIKTEDGRDGADLIRKTLAVFGDAKEER